MIKPNSRKFSFVQDDLESQEGIILMTLKAISSVENIFLPIICYCTDSFYILYLYFVSWKPCQQHFRDFLARCLPVTEHHWEGLVGEERLGSRKTHSAPGLYFVSTHKDSKDGGWPQQQQVFSSFSHSRDSGCSCDSACFCSCILT